ncbi:AAA family ATPase [Halomonas sp. MCCC 1A17488]|uniref:AAA family ATPase n=1 Tax=unclassified Halomonas TaxID=2609666 RepID=UPI0018D229A3|nr:MULTISPECIES: AAA family ATPase [unclassified Halomonas]MCE8016056.1 AAA family ATPase [Halomonas sp. MCCC 1A17488]MCG3239389.1 AAA family ATPase [Halomonas sp. MCCC 1A17488]QPP50681.1 AAA family ATPase [Halomonas sp. SS10-MC5]
MKILALRLANLASLPGPLELDFTMPPLDAAGLFAITGPTGAGKSTLLDALCLALYGNTPRLRQAPVRDAPLPDVEGDTVSTADPRTLLRRGTASGHAEVDFLGRDGRRYRARWAVRRARDKAGGRLQTAEQSLRDLDDDRLLTAQKREFDRLLPERLGLTFDQFTRAVLLAQSEFAAFLKADDNERSDLLERLTGTAEYSRISMAAYRRASEAKKRVDALQARLADDLPAEPEARAELEQAAKQAETELATLQRQNQSLEARQQWHVSDDRLRQAYAEGLRQQRDTEARWHSLADARADRECRRLLAPQRHRLLRQVALPHEIAALEDTHRQTLKALEQAKAAQGAAEQARDQAARQLEVATQARQQAEPALRQAREQTQSLVTLDQQLDELETQHRDCRQQTERLAEQRREADARQLEHKRKRDEWQAALRQLMGSHERLDAARQAAQQAHDRAARRSLALSELEGRWQEACRAEQARQQLAKQTSDDEARQAELVTQGKAARERLDERERHYTTLRDFVERSRAARSESVARLRETLHEGEPCPVCGGLDHPFRHQPPATPEAAQLAAQQAQEEQQLTEARQAFEQAQLARNELEGEYRAVLAALARCRQELQQANSRLAQAQQALIEHPLHAELNAIDAAERNAWLAYQRRECDGEREHGERTLQALTRAEAELVPLEDALRQGELALAQLEARRAALEAELNKQAQRLPPLRRQRSEVAATLQALLGEQPSVDAWQQQLEARQESARQQREQAIERCHGAEREQARLSQQAIHEAQRIEQLVQEGASLERELADWRQAHPQLDDATLARLLAQPEAEAEREERELNEADEACQRTEASLGERRRALLEHRHGQALANDDSDDALLGEEVEAEIANRREALVAERQALAPKVEHAQQARDDAVHALRDDDRRRARQQEGQAELETARTEHARWARISELIGSADGKTFRRIAQAYNLDQLLEHANAHLGGLSRRYRLTRGGSELGMLVVDHDMGDERRSVHSLSGGETFLVSLALALGLASMASGELTIESLFIDEGFGSLDPQSLALAMEALDGLQALGRRVGVISHVQEMHERIPVQIQVEPLGNGTSRARLVSL